MKTTMMMTALVTAIAATWMLPADSALAQDVPGIEICTAEKTMERRTGCLQSNINFLKSALTKSELDAQRKLDAASRRIEAAAQDIAQMKQDIAALRAQLSQPAAKDKAQDKDKDKADTKADDPAKQPAAK